MADSIAVVGPLLQGVTLAVILNERNGCFHQLSNPPQAAWAKDVKNDIKKIGIKKCARESGFTRFFVRKLLRDRTVRRSSYDQFIRWLQNEKGQSMAKYAARQ